MTHDELLDVLNYTAQDGMADEPVLLALRAVVELHNPIKDQWIDYVTCAGCRVDDDDYYSPEYPCETIQAIEKELA